MIFFKKIFIEVLDKHVPVKRKFLRASNGPYMTKILWKAMFKFEFEFI